MERNESQGLQEAHFKQAKAKVVGFWKGNELDGSEEGEKPA